MTGVAASARRDPMTRLLAAAVVAALAAPASADTPKEGTPAPAFDLPFAAAKGAAGKTKLSLADLKGKNVVLYFYPKAMTPGCTTESCGFRDVNAEFEKLDTVVLGISTDKVADQNKFVEKEKLNFPLLADSEKTVAKAYGALSQRGVASRYTFVIDRQGVIRKVYTDVKPGDHPKEVLNFVKENLK
jgi:peroxiredoxin Q/BCP